MTECGEGDVDCRWTYSGDILCYRLECGVQIVGKTGVGADDGIGVLCAVEE